MDLSLLNTKDGSEQGAWFTPKWDGEPLDCKFKVLGPDSKVAIKYTDDLSKNVQSKFALMVAGAQKNGKVKDLPEDTETFEDKDIAKASAIIVGWENVQWEGKEFPYSPENAKFLMEKASFLRNQILRFHDEQANFTPGGSLSSKKQSAKAST